MQARHRYAYSRGFPPKVHRHIKILKVYLEVVINENMVEARISTEFRSNVLRETTILLGHSPDSVIYTQLAIAKF